MAKRRSWLFRPENGTEYIAVDGSTRWRCSRCKIRKTAQNYGLSSTKNMIDHLRTFHGVTDDPAARYQPRDPSPELTPTSSQKGQIGVKCPVFTPPQSGAQTPHYTTTQEPRVMRTEVDGDGLSVQLSKAREGSLVRTVKRAVRKAMKGEKKAMKREMKSMRRELKLLRQKIREVRRVQRGTDEGEARMTPPPPESERHERRRRTSTFEEMVMSAYGGGSGRSRRRDGQGGGEAAMGDVSVVREL